MEIDDYAECGGCKKWCYTSKTPFDHVLEAEGKISLCNVCSSGLSKTSFMEEVER